MQAEQMLAALKLAGGARLDPLVLVQSMPPTWDGILEARGSVLISWQTGSLEAVLQGLEEAGYSGSLTAIADPLTARQRNVARSAVSSKEWLLLLGQPLAAPLLESLPLYGISVVVTREASQGEALCRQLQELGADVVNCPVMKFSAPTDIAPFNSCLTRLEDFDWLLFTSANGVHAFGRALLASGADLRALGHLRIGAIGPGTGVALDEWHLKADCVPSEYVAESFLESLASLGVTGQRFLLARAQEAREVLPDGLRQLGAQVEVVAVYQTLMPELEDRVRSRAQEADWVLLTSSSCAKNYARLIGLADQQKALAIGPVTAQTVRELGWSQVAMAPRYTVEGMVEKLLSASRRPAGNPLDNVEKISIRGMI